MRASFTRVSGNAKLGPIPATMTEADSCPPGCGMRAACYAEYGNVGLHWRRVGERGMEWSAMLEQVRRLPKRTIWRHNVAGDLPGKGNRISASKVRALVKANKGRHGFTYTHKPMTEANAAIVREANAAGFTINLSADNAAMADTLAELDVGPVAVVLPRDAERRSTTPGGRSIVMCPQSYSDVQCANCGACAVPGRKSIIGFPAHGARWKAADLIAKG